MTIRVLGPLEIGNTPLSPRERAILSALIVRAGTGVSPAELAEAAWADSPPLTWASQIKNAVNRIRGRLGRESIVTRGAEYELGLDAESIDAVRFERLVSTARQHLLRDEPARAVDAYSRALALWRGRPYPDLSSWEPGIVEAMRLTEIRAAAEEEHLDARLRLGEHREVTPQAERLVRENPLREDRWAILALAHYESGRQADALAVLRAARGRLLEELGIEPGPRLRALETAILHQEAVLPAPPAAPPSADCPYRGLEAFGAQDADVFFGRETDVEKILDRVRDGAVVVITGPSGCGKSSVMLAGVIPALIERGRAVTLVPGGQAATTAAREASAAHPSVLAIDQAEEILRSTPADIAAFCDAARDFADGGGTVILTVRSDFLDDAIALPDVGAAIGRGVYALAPLNADALRAAIEHPAAHANLRVEPGLVELIIRDAADRATTLPHVSHALLETWLRREGDTLTVAGYEASGGLAGAIATSAESLYRSLPSPDQDLCRSLMLRLVAREPDGASLRRRIPTTQLAGDADRRRVIDRLAAARLVTIDNDFVVIAHEALAAAWPRLDNWLQEGADRIRELATIESATSSWDAEGRSDDALMRGARLQTALEVSGTLDSDLTDLERLFLSTSADRAENEVRDLAHRAARESRQNRRLRLVLAAAAVLLVGAITAGSFAAVRGAEAAAAADDALLEALTSRSAALLDTNRNISSLLAVAAHERWPDDVRVRAALMGVVTAAGPSIANTAIPGAQTRIGAWPVPGTDTAVVASDYSRLEVRSLTDGALVRELDDMTRADQHVFRPWVRVSDDGSTVVVMQHIAEDDNAGDPDEFGDELLRFYSLTTGSRIGDPVRVDDLAETVSVSTDGRFATWVSYGDLLVADRDTGRVQRLPDPSAEGARAFGGSSDFLADGRVLFVTNSDTALTVDPLTLAVEAAVTLAGGSGGYTSAVSDDGILVSVGDDGAWATDLGSGTELWTADTNACTRSVISTAQRLFICGDERGLVHFRSLDTGEALGDPFDYQLSGAGDLALSRDEEVLFLLSAVSPTIGQVRIDGSGPASTRIGEPGDAMAAPLDPSGRYAVLANGVQWRELADPEVDYVIWDLVDRSPVARLPELITDPPTRLIGDLRWIDERRLVAWFLGPGGDQLAAVGVVDLDTGEVHALPNDTDWVYSDERGERFFASVVDDPETTENEARVDVYALDTLTIEVSIPIDGQVKQVTQSADGSRFVVTVGRDNPPLWFSYVFDRTGTLLAEGLPLAHLTEILDDRHLVAVEAQGLTLYEIDTLERVGSLPANTFWSASLSHSDDGVLLTHSHLSSSIALIDVDSRRQLGIPIDNGDEPATSAITPDGRRFVQSSSRGTFVWTLDPLAHVEAACRLAGREPTAEEWADYFSGLGEQHPLCS